MKWFGNRIPPWLKENIYLVIYPRFIHSSSMPCCWVISVRIVTTSRLKYFVYFRSNLPGLQLRRLQGCHQFSAKISMARNFNAHILWRQFLIRSYFQDMNHGKHQFKVVIWIIINRLRSCNINILKYAVGRRQSAQTAFFRFLIRGCSGLGLDRNVWLSTLPGPCLHKSYSWCC